MVAHIYFKSIVLKNTKIINYIAVIIWHFSILQAHATNNDMFEKLIVNKKKTIIILKNETKAYSYRLEFTSICSKNSFTAGLVRLSSIILCTFFKAFNVVRIQDAKCLFLFKIIDIMIAACNKTMKHF